jgi:protein tyrosine/serine phosphatase
MRLPHRCANDAPAFEGMTMDTTIDASRVLPLAGIHNFRDYGGYRADGGSVRRGLLFRSGQHGAATADDLEKVAALNIATVIDLRGDTERREMPCLRHQQFAGQVLFAPGETAGQELAPHEEAGRGITTADEARAGMTALYRNMPYRAVLIESLKLYFDALATRDGASLLHCAAGKDRTGLAAALLHTLLGVHHDDIMADYLLTNTAGDPRVRIESAAPMIRARYGATMTDDAIVALMSVDERYLLTALDAIRASHGTVERYADEVLGVTPERRDMLRARLVG